MKTRILTAVTILAFTNSVSPAAQSGDQVVLEISGDLAKEYAKATQGAKPDDGLRIEVIATVAQQLPDGRLRIEHSSLPRQRTTAAPLVTLTAVVPSSKLITQTIPKGTKVYSSPGSQESIETSAQTSMQRVTLSNLKDLKLRTWTLANEIGN